MALLRTTPTTVSDSTTLETIKRLSHCPRRPRLRTNRWTTVTTISSNEAKLVEIKSKGKGDLCEDVFYELVKPLMVIVCLLV